MFLLSTINKHNISQKVNEFSSGKVNMFFINLDIFVITSAIRKKWNDIAFTSTYIELLMNLLTRYQDIGRQYAWDMTRSKTLNVIDRTESRGRWALPVKGEKVEAARLRVLCN